MKSDDDQDWLDALAGRGFNDSQAAREAAPLRDAMLGRSVDPTDAAIAARDEAREAALIARARREGLIKANTVTPQRRWAFGWDNAFAVAAIAGIAVAIGLYIQPTIDREVVRSSPDGVVRIEATDPVQLKRQLLEELRAAGVEATGYETLGRQGIDADLPRPLTEAVRRVLEKHRIPPPADGVLRVEIFAKAPQ